MESEYYVILCRIDIPFSHKTSHIQASCITVSYNTVIKNNIGAGNFLKINSYKLWLLF